jgi:Uma2 family endonuclease
MRAGLRPRYTFAEYLAVERASREVRHEYVAGDIFAMAGGSVQHSALASALVGLLFARLRGGPWRAHGAELGIGIRAADVATYADVTVVCDPIERDPESPTHVTNPRAVFEVLSPATERYDREQKRLYYQQLPALREYVLVAQDRRRVELWRREEGDVWHHSVHDAGAHVTLESIAHTFAVDDLYDAADVL